MSVSFCFPHPVAVSAFMICRGLCACTGLLWMCVLYVSFGSKVRPRTFGCVAMGSALLFIIKVISSFRSLRAGSQVFALLMLFLGLFCMSSGKSLQLLCILPFGMFCLSAISMMFVKIMLAVCMLVGMVV